MTLQPLRARSLGNAELVFVGENGAFFQGGLEFAARLAADQLDVTDQAFLEDEGFNLSANDHLARLHHDYRVAQRLTKAGSLDYLILVPTLRCNLSCSYCQVSRAPETAAQFDWNEETLSAVLALIDGLPTSSIKIEFQGGEPTLRPDLIRRVIERCTRFDQQQFVICTNLQRLGSEQWALFDDPRVFISTSLDGTVAAHERQRTPTGTGQFLTNLRQVIDRYGPDKVSALPTIDPRDPPAPDEIVDTFRSFGLTSIFLRPINFHGFARKRHAESQAFETTWPAYHRAFVEHLIERNWQDRSAVLEETYFSLCLRRIFFPLQDRHVDLRNPNPMGVDYLVIDHDGTLYPTDEARMLSRSGVVDLALGKIGEDWNGETWATLNAHATNQFDPDCARCAYQPYCGRDLVDDLARYGRIDLPRHETAFCQRHLSLFDYAFELLYRDDPKARYSIARWLRLDGDPDAFGSIAP